MTIRLEAKRPNEVIDYEIDWSQFLGTDTIANSTITVVGATLDNASNNHTTTGVALVLSGGTSGTIAKVTNTIVTAGGRTETEVVLLPISAGELVSLDEAKQHLRIVDDDSEDSLIEGYIVSARMYVERESNYVFSRRQFTETYYGCWPNYIKPNRRPVISIDQIQYQDLDGTTQSLTGYKTTIDFRRVFLSPWPALMPGGSISLTYTAGFAEEDEVDAVQLARQAILMLVGHWYAHRETVNTSAVIPAEVPYAVTSLIGRFRDPVM